LGFISTRSTKCVIGIDVGSQGAKAVLVGHDGECLASARKPYSPTVVGSVRVEQDPSVWVSALRELVPELTAKAGAGPTDVSHLALACQVDGIVPVDSKGEPLRPAMIWMDRRASKQTDFLDEVAGSDAVFMRTGLNLDPSHGAPKMMWLLENEPEVCRQAERFLPVGSFLVSWLTGEVAQDYANASSSMLFDLRTKDWDGCLLGHSGIEKSLLPPVLPAETVAGELKPDRASELGLASSCRVLVGTADEHAAVIAGKAETGSTIIDVSGTAEVVSMVTDRLELDDERLVETHFDADPTHFLLENPGFASGGSVLWLSQLLGCSQPDVFELAEGQAAGNGGLTFIPALNGSVTPRWNPRMGGAFFPLDLSHGAGALSRAVLEGCAFALRDVVDRLRSMSPAASEIVALGGGSRSSLWLQMKADVTGMPVRAVMDHSPSACGAAAIALVAAGVHPDTATAMAMISAGPDASFEPDPGSAEAYEESYGRYRSMFDALEPILR